MCGEQYLARAHVCVVSYSHSHSHTAWKQFYVRRVSEQLSRLLVFLFLLWCCLLGLLRRRDSSFSWVAVWTGLGWAGGRWIDPLGSPMWTCWMDEVRDSDISVCRTQVDCSVWVIGVGLVVSCCCCCVLSGIPYRATPEPWSFLIHARY